MFGLFRKEDKKKKDAVGISTKAIINERIRQETATVNSKFKKPEYNPTTRKEFYDDGMAHKAVKEAAFRTGEPVRDPYTNEQLVSTVREAKQNYHAEWQEHLAEADHIDTLSKFVQRNKNKSFISTEDLKNIGNRADNYQIISRATNQTGGKGGYTQEEWSNRPDLMEKLSERSGETQEELTGRVREIGRRAEKESDELVQKTRIKNLAKTAGEAAKEGGTAGFQNAVIISSIYNIVACIKGEKKSGEALLDVGLDGVKNGVYGAASTAAFTVVNHTLASQESQFLKMIGNSNAIGTTVDVVIMTGETIVDWGKGEITTSECITELGGKGAYYVGNKVGAAVGAQVLPGIGNIIGGMIGGILVSGIYDNTIGAIKEKRERELYEAMMRYYAEQCRREEVQRLIRTNTTTAFIESAQSIIASGEFQRLLGESSAYFREHRESEQQIAECIIVTLQLQEYRKQLNNYINQYFSEYEECFSDALDYMDTALKQGNFDEAIYGVNQVTELFGQAPVIEGTDDFRSKIFGKTSIIL